MQLSMCHIFACSEHGESFDSENATTVHSTPGTALLVLDLTGIK